MRAGWGFCVKEKVIPFVILHWAKTTAKQRVPPGCSPHPTALHIFHFYLPIALLCRILLYCFLVCTALSSCCHLSYMWIINPMRQNCLSGCRVLSVMNPQPISESLRCQSNVNTNRKMKRNGSIAQSLLDSIVTLQYFALCRKYKISDKQGTPQARWKRLCDLGNNRHCFFLLLVTASMGAWFWKVQS